MRDLVNQIVLGTFIATFVYCLLILRTVRDIDNVQFVPYISTTCGLAMAVLSLGMLIYFIHHVSVSIQADTVISSVSHDLLDALNRLFPKQETPEESDTGSLIPGQLNRLLGDMARDGRPIMANQSGYLQVINKKQLVQVAIDHQCLIRFEYRPGDFITQDCPLATVLPGTRADNGLSAAIHDVLMIGKQRTYEQDVGFAFHQLVEIAVRALSPGINDPFTAVACIERLGASFCQLAKRSVPSVYQFDDDGQLRAIVPNLTFVDVVQGGLDPIRQYCRSSLTVTLQLLHMMTVVAPHISQEAHRDVLLHQAEMIVRGSYDGLPEQADREQVEACYQEVKRALQP
jgi:uncharacterized membrane protein